MYSTVFRMRGFSGSYQAVSSMKMPSFSSCINTSPPGKNKSIGVFAGLSFISKRAENGGKKKKIPMPYRSDTPV